MSDLKSILSEEYNKVASTLNIKELLNMVEEVMELPIAEYLAPELVKERKTQDLTFKLSMIPEIEVSELGWSDVRTPEGGGEPVKGRERQLLESYLENILGGDVARGLDSLPQQLDKLSSFYNNPEQYLDAADTRPQKIQQAVSMLVFYKTLTKIIANFNASSAGFSFESFLATLLDGIQVPANTGTIADFYAGGTDGEPVSLKLYNEKSVEVGGSFVDLVGDLLNDSKDNRMTYLVVMKNLKGEAENLTGNLTFYQFDFTLDNVMDIIGDSKPASAATIILPLEGEQLPDVDAPERIRITTELVQDLFVQNLKDLIGNDQIVDAIVSSPYFQYGTDEMLSLASTSAPVRRYADKRKASNRENMEQILRGIPTFETEEDLSQVVLVIYEALDKASAQVKELRAGRKEKIAQILPSLSGYRVTKGSKGEKRAGEAENISAAAEKSIQFYDNLKGNREAQKKALLKTNGYLNEMQFSLNKAEVMKLAEPMASLEVGAEAIQKMLSQTTSLLNSEVFSIFDSLRNLSDNLNGFFASGLGDTEKATNAIENAQDIETKTEKVQSDT
tara:strand:- start:510 stop:2195 length:1686 start_codon:yes stop_codon:yes gene_type:complete